MIDLIYEFDSYTGFVMALKDTLPDIRLWCNENCRGYFIAEILGNCIKISFSETEDAMAFKLRWL